jgi:uncharacterized protein
MTTIGVLADTHGHLDPQILVHFAGVSHILHGGDIGLPWLILQLESIAPVTAVAGNMDAGLDFKELEVVSLGGRKFLVQHEVEPGAPAEKLRRRILRENPEVVIFGHTHRRYCERIGQTLYLNPGYAGAPRNHQERTVALIHCAAGGVTAEFRTL